MSYKKGDQLKKKPRTVKTERKRLIVQLDNACRDFLKKTESQCCCCGKTTGLQVGHFVTRRVYVLRWDVRNIHLQCSGCNLRHNYDPVPYSSYMLKTYGKGIFDDLQKEKSVVVKMTNQYLQELKEFYQSMI